MLSTEQVEIPLEDALLYALFPERWYDSTMFPGLCLAAISALLHQTRLRFSKA